MGEDVCIGGRLSAFPALLLRERVKKKSSELGQLAQATVMPGATQHPSLSQPHNVDSDLLRPARHRPSVDGAAQQASGRRKAPLPAPRSQARVQRRERAAPRGRGGIGCTMLPSSGKPRECSAYPELARVARALHAVGACPAQRQPQDVLLAGGFQA